jgi:hypothetical protein
MVDWRQFDRKRLCRTQEENMSATSEVKEANPITVTELDHLSPSNLEMFRTCPHKWAAHYLHGIRQKSSDAADIGTMMHKVTQIYLHGQLSEPEQFPGIHVVPIKERAALGEYLATHEEIRPFLIGTEIELRMQMRPDIPPILMAIDAAFGYPDGTLLIEDHKSNRAFETQDVWAKRMQPKIYAWAARRMWPQYHTLRFKIGYPNLGTSVEWQIHPEEDLETEAEVFELWRQMLEYSQHGLAGFPQTFNKSCGFCPMKTRCKEYISTVENFSMDMAGLVTLTPVERYRKIKAIEKAVTEAVKEAKSAAVDYIKENGGKVKSGDKVAVAKIEQERKVSFRQVWEAFTDPNDYDELLVEELFARANELFSVRLTGLDEFIKAQPSLKRRVDGLIQKVDNDSPTIRFVNPK